MSTERRALVATIESGLADLHTARLWWRDEAGALISYRGPDEFDTFLLGCKAAAHFARFKTVFDVALDWLSDARDARLSDTEARNLVPLAQGEAMERFHAEGMALAQSLADWRSRHAPANCRQ